MYITIRAFRNYGDMIPAGMKVEPSQIRRLKDKIREGKIAVITPANKEAYEATISRRLGKAFSIDSAESYTGKFYVEEPEVVEEPAKVVARAVAKEA